MTVTEMPFCLSNLIMWLVLVHFGHIALVIETIGDSV